MSDDLARHGLGRLPRRLSSRAVANDRAAAGPGEAARVVAVIADRLGIEPRVIESSLAGRCPRGTLERTE